MTKLDVSISSIRYSIEVNNEELESFKDIIKSLNEKTNELMLETGKISDRLILFILLLININKREKIFDNFEKNIIKLLKNIAPLLNKNEDLDSQLILAGIITESQTSELKEPKNIYIEEEELAKLKRANDNNNEETLKFIDEIIKFVEKLANNINKI